MNFSHILFSDELEGYIHNLTSVKTSKKSGTSYFNCQLQMSHKKLVRAVCFSPKKRIDIQQVFKMKSPIKIKGIKRSLNKSFSGRDDEEITITKAAKITPTTAPFEYDESLASHLHSITECLNANIYETVDVKVKVLTKSLNKQPIIRNERKL